MAKMKVDFTGVSDGGGADFDIKPGKYHVEVIEVTVEGPGTSGYKYLKWVLSITEGVHKKARINHITTLKPEGLFNLRNTLMACGLTIPKSAISFDPDKLVGKEFGIEVVMRADKKTGDEYPNVKNVFSLEDEEDGEDDDDGDVVLE